MSAITVFTPTFNRAHTLQRLYESLCRQTCRDFEWLIIDDGSSDNTRNLLAEFRTENRIPMRCIHKENGGLHTGYNTAYANIDSELSVCIDSDDYMPDDAIEKIMTLWRERGGEGYAGITGLDFFAGTETPIGGYFPADMKEAYLLDLYIKGIHRGDSKQVMRTELMKRYIPMEGFPGEKNFNPIYLLLQACDELPVLILNENLCFVEYQEADSMSKSIWKQYADSPRSFARERVMEMKLRRSTFLNNLRLSIHYTASCLISKDKNWLRNTPCKLSAIVTSPAALLLYLLIKIKNRG